jgi:hypothetical protein
MVSNGGDVYLVQSGDGCYDIADSNSSFLDNF